MFLIRFRSPGSRLVRGLVLPFLLAIFLPVKLSASYNDNMPRPITICSGASILILGDPLIIAPGNYAWEMLQNGVWVAAPGTNNTTDYLASSLLNPGNADVVFNLRRRMTVLALPVYDSYYMVTVQPILPILNNIITAPAIAIFCGTANPTTINGSIPSSGNSTFLYQWQSSTDNISFSNINGANAKDYTPGSLSSTVYFRRIAISGGCGLTSTSNVVTLTVATLPQVPELTESKMSVCAGSAAVLKVKNPLPGLVYKWYDSPAKNNLLFTGDTYLTEVLNQSKTYYAESSNGTCNSTTLQQIEVEVMPRLSTVSVTAEALSATSMLFKWNAVVGASAYKISFDNGLTFIDPSSGTLGLSHTMTGMKGKQTVAVQVKAIGILTCQESSSIKLNAQTPSEYDDIYVPNAFTPNGDGKNDVLYVRSETIKSLEFYIYSQWGEQIFNSRSVSVGWDGNYKGSRQPVGVYVYYLKAVMENGRELTKKGTITLIK